MRNIERQFSGAGSSMTRAAEGVNRQFDRMRQQISPLQRYMQSFGQGGRNSLEGIQQQIDTTTQHLNEFKAAIASGGLEMDKSYTEARNKLNALRQEMSMLTSLTQQYGPKLAQTMVDGMKPMFELQGKQKEIQKKFAELTFDSAKFKGDTAAYIAEIQKVGAEQKKVNDQLMAANQMAKMGIIQTVGYMLNASTQSEKIAANFKRMGDPIAPLNNALLGVGKSLEKLAKQGNAAVLALKHLGPNANMKQLNDYIMMINMGLMRTSMLALVMGGVFVGALAGINKLLEANGLTQMSDAAAHLGQTLNTALLPFLKSFDSFAAAIIRAVDAVAGLWAKFSQLNPELAAGVGWFALLFIGLMVLLAPLAVGIGLAGGLAASFSALWMVISPFVIGFLAVAGTAIAIAAALVLVGLAVYELWTRTTWFKDAVLGAWAAIQTGTAMVWAAIVAFVTPAIEAIGAFIQEKMTAVQAFWAENGQMILQAAQNVWTVIAGVIAYVAGGIFEVMQWLWPVIKILIVGTWDAIKNVISGALDIIMGVIKFFAALFTGDWEKLWEATKQIIHGALELMWGWIQLFGVGRILKFFGGLAGDLLKVVAEMWGKIKYEFDFKLLQISDGVSGVFNKIVSFVKGLGSTFYDAGKGLIEMMANGIKNAAKAVYDTVEKIAGKIRDFLPFSPAKTGPLSDLDKLDFGGPIADSISGAIPRINGMMGDLLTMPAIDANVGFSEQNKEPAMLNFDRMFDGASISVRDDLDIKQLAREIYSFTNSRARGMGVRIP
jgi:phage-related protein